MNQQPFSLEPFTSAGPPSAFQITGDIARHSHILAIRYALQGPLATLVIPPPSDSPARKNGLWKETCFEFFLAVKDSPRYWEFNLSPAGHWNVYGFSGYRRGLQEEITFVSFPFSVQKDGDSLLLALKLDLACIVPAHQALEAAISAIIQHQDGPPTYWALTHRGPKPDFHSRDGFIVAV
jgi:hypothetical protein